MSLTLGELNVRLGLDSTSFNREISQAESKSTHFGNILNNALSTAGGIILAQAIRGVGDALGSVIGNAANFESQMSAIKAVMVPTQDQMAALSVKARELGASTQFSATQSASAIEMLAKNGVKYEDIMNGMIDGTLALAAATGADLSLAADIATDVMAAFSLEASEMSRVADGITGVLQQSKFGINDYKLALANGGAAVGAFGMSLEDFNTTIAITSSQFASGQTAGTALRNVIFNLAPSTDRATEKMKELGLITADGANQFFTSTGELKSMVEVMALLQGAMGDLASEDLIAAVDAMFGKKSIGTVIGLLQSTTTEYETMYAAISNTSAADAAAARMDNFQGAITLLKSAFEGLTIAIGTPIIQALTPLIRQLAEGVSNVTRFVEALTSSSDQASQTSVVFQQVAGTITEAFRPLAERISAYLQVIWNVAQEVAANIRAYWQQNGQTILENARTVWTGIVTTIGSVLDTILSVVGNVLANVYAYWKENGARIIETVQTALQAVYNIVSSIATSIYEYWDQNGHRILMSVQNTWSVVYTTISDIVTSILAAVTPILQSIYQFWQENGDAILHKAGEIYIQVQTLIQVALEFIRTVVVKVLEDVQRFWEKHGNDIMIGVKNAWDIISLIVSTALDTIIGILKFATNIINGDWDRAWYQLYDLTSIVLSGIANIVIRILEAIANSIGSSLSDIGRMWTDSWFMFLDIVGIVKDNLVNGISDFFNSALTIGSSIIDGIRDGIINKAWELITAGIDTVNGVLQGIKDYFGIRSPSTMFAREIGVPLSDGIIAGFNGNQNNLENAIVTNMEDLATLMLDPFAVTEQQLQRYLSDISKSIDNYLSSARNAIRDLRKQAESELKAFSDIASSQMGGGRSLISLLPDKRELDNIGKSLAKLRKDATKLEAERDAVLLEIDVAYRIEDEKRRATELQKASDKYRKLAKAFDDTWAEIYELEAAQTTERNLVEKEEREVRFIQDDLLNVKNIVKEISKTDPLGALEFQQREQARIIESAKLEADIRKATDEFTRSILIAERDLLKIKYDPRTVAAQQQAARAAQIQAVEQTVYNMSFDLSGSNLSIRDLESLIDQRLAELARIAKGVR